MDSASGRPKFKIQNYNLNAAGVSGSNVTKWQNYTVQTTNI